MRIKFLPINKTPKSEDVLVLLKKGRIERAKYNPRDCYMDTDQALMEYMINRLVDSISEAITKERSKNGR